MRIDKQVAKEISDKIKNFVNSLETQYGVEVAKTSGSFSDAEPSENQLLSVNLKPNEIGHLHMLIHTYDFIGFLFS